jgi:hypothetical protein
MANDVHLQGGKTMGACHIAPMLAVGKEEVRWRDDRMYVDGTEIHISRRRSGALPIGSP